jgi:hypothetical protein
MTHQETIWKGKTVMPVSIKSKSGGLHHYVKRYIGITGIVQKESKNGMLLVWFMGNTKYAPYRVIPAGCLIEVKSP